MYYIDCPVYPSQQLYELALMFFYPLVAYQGTEAYKGDMVFAQEVMEPG